MDPISSWLTFIARRRRQLRKSHCIRTPQYILNDTSLAAVFSLNEDQQLFFQNNTGLIRHAVRVDFNGQWTTSPNLNASTA